MLRAGRREHLPVQEIGQRRAWAPGVVVRHAQVHVGKEPPAGRVARARAGSSGIRGRKGSKYIAHRTALQPHIQQGNLWSLSYPVSGRAHQALSAMRGEESRPVEVPTNVRVDRLGARERVGNAELAERGLTWRYVR